MLFLTLLFIVRCMFRAGSDTKERSVKLVVCLAKVKCYEMLNMFSKTSIGEMNLEKVFLLLKSSLEFNRSKCKLHLMHETLACKFH